MLRAHAMHQATCSKATGPHTISGFSKGTTSLATQLMHPRCVTQVQTVPSARYVHKIVLFNSGAHCQLTAVSNHALPDLRLALEEPIALHVRGLFTAHLGFSVQQCFRTTWRALDGFMLMPLAGDRHLLAPGLHSAGRQAQGWRHGGFLARGCQQDCRPRFAVMLAAYQSLVLTVDPACCLH